MRKIIIFLFFISIAILFLSMTIPSQSDDVRIIDELKMYKPETPISPYYVDSISPYYILMFSIEEKYYFLGEYPDTVSVGKIKEKNGFVEFIEEDEKSILKMKKVDDYRYKIIKSDTIFKSGEYLYLHFVFGVAEKGSTLRSRLIWDGKKLISLIKRNTDGKKEYLFKNGVIVDSIFTPEKKLEERKYLFFRKDSTSNQGGRLW